MVLAIVVSVLGLLLVLVAYYRDPPIRRPRLETGWDLLPDPAEVARTEFPLAMPGYESATVEAHFEELNRAYADLLAAAPPDVVARARHRAALRQGVDVDVDAAPAPAAAAAPLAPARATAVAPISREAADSEALQAEAALAQIDAQGGPVPPRRR